MSSVGQTIGGEAVTTRLAMKMENSLQAFAVRAACFIGELDVPYSEEFDGHDFGATHIIAYVGDEPVGALRVRWFQSFAMPERLAVMPALPRPQHRAAPARARAARWPTSRGCNMLYAQVLPADVEYWEKQGGAAWCGGEEQGRAPRHRRRWCGRGRLPQAAARGSRRPKRSVCGEAAARLAWPAERPDRESSWCLRN